MNGDAPADVRRFEFAALTSVALSIPNTILAELTRADDAASLTLNDFLLQVVIAGVVALVVLAASRNRSNKARWLFAVLVFAEFALTAWMPSIMFDSRVLASLLNAVQLLLDAAACVLLFTASSRAWFAGARPPG